MSAYLTRLEERLWARVDKRGPSDCWPWGGPPTAQGYGQISVGGPELVHRVIYQLVKGEIPKGFHVDHTCHNEDLSCPGGKECLHRRCCNPAHLEAVPPKENSERAHGPRNRGSQKTHCPQNHKYDEKNTMWIKKVRRGKTYDTRMCRTCNRDRARARKAAEG
jgi:hypothetical protein